MTAKDFLDDLEYAYNTVADYVSGMYLDLKWDITSAEPVSFIGHLAMHDSQVVRLVATVLDQIVSIPVSAVLHTVGLFVNSAQAIRDALSPPIIIELLENDEDLPNG